MSNPVKIAIGVCLAAGIFAAGYLSNRNAAPPPSSASARRVLYYTCPMHPQYKSDRPGDAPCCGMQLVAVYAGATDGKPESETAGPAGLVNISADKQQLVGVRTDKVGTSSTSVVLRLAGRVAVDDSRSFKLIAAADGWIRDLGANSPGTFVKENEVLATYYTRDLQSAQQTLLFGLATGDQLASGELSVKTQRAPANANVNLAIDTLRSLGLTDTQLDELRKTRQTRSEVDIRSPASGFVTARNISPRQRFEKGSELYRISDISRVWAMVDISEKDREFVKPDAVATVRYRGAAFPAHIGKALPQFDPQSRTFKTRFELDNPAHILRPDMFVDVEMRVDMPSALTVPVDSIIDTGRRQTVFVERGDGQFEPRVVTTGWRLGDRVQILAGLHDGERIVVSGNFLIDSESRMKSVAAAMIAPPPAAAHAAMAKDPVCGMDVDPNAPKALHIQHSGKTYYFCSRHCKETFEADPARRAAKKMPAAGPA